MKCPRDNGKSRHESDANAEEHRRWWYFKCGCGNEFKIREIGGIRYRARGNPIKAARYPPCGSMEMMKLLREKALAGLLYIIGYRYSAGQKPPDMLNESYNTVIDSQF